MNNNDNVVPFPGHDELKDMRFSKKVAQNVSKGKKVSQQQAFGALLEMRQMVNNVIQSLSRVVQSQMEYERIIQGIDTNLSVLTSLLIDKEVISQQDLDGAWEKYVVEPQEKAMDKHIEKMKAQSAEEAFFAEVLTMVRAHEWPTRTVGEQEYTSKQIRDFYVQMLLNPGTRKQILDEIRKEIPEVPNLDFEKLAELNQEDQPEDQKPTEARKLPDCRYCGKEDCAFCNPPVEEETVDDEPKDTE